MVRVNIPILILNIVMLGGGLALVILGAINWGAGCGLEYIFIGIGALLLICPLTCICNTIRSRSDYVIFERVPKENE